MVFAGRDFPAASLDVVALLSPTAATAAANKRLVGVTELPTVPTSGEPAMNTAELILRDVSRAIGRVFGNEGLQIVVDGWFVIVVNSVVRHDASI